MQDFVFVLRLFSPLAMPFLMLNLTQNNLKIGCLVPDSDTLTVELGSFYETKQIGPFLFMHAAPRCMHALQPVTAQDHHFQISTHFQFCLITFPQCEICQRPWHKLTIMHSHRSIACKHVGLSRSRSQLCRILKRTKIQRLPANYHVRV